MEDRAVVEGTRDGMHEIAVAIRKRNLGHQACEGHCEGPGGGGSCSTHHVDFIIDEVIHFSSASQVVRFE